MGYRDDLAPSQPPGYGLRYESEQREFLYRPLESAYMDVTIDKDTVDTENSGKTTRLRPGLVLVPNVARTLYVNLEHADSPVQADLALVLVGDPVVLSEYRETKDAAGVVQNITAKVLTMGNVIAERILWGATTTDYVKGVIKSKMPRVLFTPGHEPE
jgi:hypothetical protein